jgi:hypothetical protein
LDVYQAQQVHRCSDRTATASTINGGSGNGTASTAAVGTNGNGNAQLMVSPQRGDGGGKRKGAPQKGRQPAAMARRCGFGHWLAWRMGLRWDWGAIPPVASLMLSKTKAHLRYPLHIPRRAGSDA